MSVSTAGFASLIGPKGTEPGEMNFSEIQEDLSIREPSWDRDCDLPRDSSPVCAPSSHERQEDAGVEWGSRPRSVGIPSEERERERESFVRVRERGWLPDRDYSHFE